MDLNEYQKKAMTTCMESSNNYEYMYSGLASEFGEFSGKVAKAIRKGIAKISNGRLVCAASVNDNNFSGVMKQFMELKHSLMLELGDVMWQTAGLAHVMGWQLEDVGEANLAKLAARKENGTIDGNGDGVTKEERL